MLPGPRRVSGLPRDSERREERVLEEAGAPANRKARQRGGHPDCGHRTPISTEADGPERLARIPFATVVRATALRVFMIAAGRWLALGMAGRCVELGVIARAALVRDRVSLSTVAIVKEDARGAENRPQEEASCTEQGDW